MTANEAAIRKAYEVAEKKDVCRMDELFSAKTDRPSSSILRRRTYRLPCLL